MKKFFALLGILTLLPGTAQAQSSDEPAFGGFKIGVSIDRRTIEGEYKLPELEARLDKDKSGIGYRGHIGYDLQIGNLFVVGVEGGLGRGGRSISTDAGIADYTLKPRWNWDLSGRVGVLPTSTLLLYGRAGHSWLQVNEITDFQDVKRLDIENKGIEKGFLWGAGVEAAVTSGLSARAEYNRADYGDGLRSSRIQLGLSLGF